METTMQSIGVTASVKPVEIYPAGKKIPEQFPEAARQQKQSLTPHQMKEAVKELNAVMQQMGTSLTFSIDSATKKTVVKVLNTETQEVVRQIPSEEMLRMSQRITELLGVLFDDVA
jgi:flagellar protein FlaG